jgi:thioredoxin reductase (NADPH)
MSKYDVIIIGGGPIGLACGIAAKKAGLSYIILEKGCLVNSLYNYPVNMTFFSTAERLEIGGVPFMSTNPKPRKYEALEYYRKVADIYHLQINLFEKVENVAAQTDGSFMVKTNRQMHCAGNVVVATGFYDLPFLMDVPGEHLPKVSHYYTDPHYYAFQNVVVVGASNSAVDAALETWRKGAHVTMVIREKGIGERVKYWVRPDIINRIAEGSIKAYYHSTLGEIREKEVDIKTPDGVVTIPNDFVLALTGYQPDLGMLRRMNITLSDDAIFCPTYNADTMETNVPGIYLAGVVCGGMNTHKLFIENSREHAEKIIKHIVTKQYIHERRALQKQTP